MKLFDWFSYGQEENPAIPAIPAILNPGRGVLTLENSKNSTNSSSRAFPETAHVFQEDTIYINKVDNYARTDEQDRRRESKHARAAIPAWQTTAQLPWSGRMQTLAAWFQQQAHELPYDPFDLRDMHIADPTWFYYTMALAVEAGPSVKSGDLEADLAALYERWAIQRSNCK